MPEAGGFGFEGGDLGVDEVEEGGAGFVLGEEEGADGVEFGAVGEVVGDVFGVVVDQQGGGAEREEG